MITAALALLVGLALGLSRAVAYELRTTRRNRARIVDLEGALLDSGVQVRYLQEHVATMGDAVNANANLAMQGAHRIDHLLDQLRQRDAKITEQARLLTIAQQQTRNLPTTDFLYSKN